jgi:hypothetical protein
MMQGDQRRWSQRVTRESNALDLEEGVFTWSDPARIARSLQASAERSKRRKADPFRSAMSMLVFYINRAGRKLDPQQKAVLEEAKDELRKLYARAQGGKKPRPDEKGA